MTNRFDYYLFLLNGKEPNWWQIHTHRDKCLPNSRIWHRAHLSTGEDRQGYNVSLLRTEKKPDAFFSFFLFVKNWKWNRTNNVNQNMQCLCAAKYFFWSHQQISSKCLFFLIIKNSRNEGRRRHDHTQRDRKNNYSQPHFKDKGIIHRDRVIVL